MWNYLLINGCFWKPISWVISKIHSRITIDVLISWYVLMLSMHSNIGRDWSGDIIWRSKLMHPSIDSISSEVLLCMSDPILGLLLVVWIISYLILIVVYRDISNLFINHCSSFMSVTTVSCHQESTCSTISAMNVNSSIFSLNFYSIKG